MGNNSPRERRIMNPGIKINNILTSLVLGVMAWVGINIDVIKNDVGTIRTETKLNAQSILNNTTRIHSISQRLAKHEEKDYTIFRGMLKQ